MQMKRVSLWDHHAVCACVLVHFSFLISWLIFTKLGINIMTFEATSVSYFLFPTITSMNTHIWPCGGRSNTSAIKLEYWNTYDHVFQSLLTYHPWTPWHPHEVCQAHSRSFRTLIQNCLFFRPFEMLIFRICAKLQVIELMLIVTLFILF